MLAFGNETFEQQSIRCRTSSPAANLVHDCTLKTYLET